MVWSSGRTKPWAFAAKTLIFEEDLAAGVVLAEGVVSVPVQGQGWRVVGEAQVLVRPGVLAEGVNGEHGPGVRGLWELRCTGSIPEFGVVGVVSPLVSRGRGRDAPGQAPWQDWAALFRFQALSDAATRGHRHAVSLARHGGGAGRKFDRAAYVGDALGGLEHRLDFLRDAFPNCAIVLVVRDPVSATAAWPRS